MTVVDKGGIFTHRTRYCGCKRHTSVPILLLQMGLYPGTVKEPSTSFTFRCLEYFHVDSMECRTSASNFINKIRRLTNNTFPMKTPVSHISHYLIFPDCYVTK
jgi:hypothetical protein